MRDYYQRNKDEYRTRERRLRVRNREYIRALKMSPCTRCGESFPPSVMDFHHRDPSKKDRAIQRLANSGTASLARIQLEIDKCDLLCANCHRIVTHEEQPV